MGYRGRVVWKRVVYMTYHLWMSKEGGFARDVKKG